MKAPNSEEMSQAQVIKLALKRDLTQKKITESYKHQIQLMIKLYQRH